MTVYATMLRPAGYATLPPDVRWEYVTCPWDLGSRPDLPRAPAPYRYGTFTTDRPLTAAELEQFSIQIVPQGDNA